MTNVTVVLDIAKNVFHAIFVTSLGKITHKKQLKRSATLSYIAKLPAQVIAIQAFKSDSKRVPFSFRSSMAHLFVVP
ncbi:hypothetical protein [Vibrio comitans]